MGAFTPGAALLPAGHPEKPGGQEVSSSSCQSIYCELLGPQRAGSLSPQGRAGFALGPSLSLGFLPLSPSLGIGPSLASSRLSSLGQSSVAARTSDSLSVQQAG